MTTKPPKTKPSCDLIHPVLSRFHNDDSYLTHNACEDIQKLFDTFYVAEIERLNVEIAKLEHRLKMQTEVTDTEAAMKRHNYKEIQKLTAHLADQKKGEKIK